MASHTIASGTTVSSKYTNSTDNFTLVNDGLVTVTSGDAVSLQGNDDVLVSQGIIAGADIGVQITGGSVTNLSGGLITGTQGIRVTGSAAGSVTNAGTIRGDTNQSAGIILTAGGYITNQSGGLIAGKAAINASGGAVTLLNAGSISGNVTVSGGVFIQAGGSVTNQSGGRITGLQGVAFRNQPGTVVNNAIIAGNTAMTTGYGVYLAAGGTVTNNASGAISGVVGVKGAGGAVTLLDAGSISGAVYNGATDAVQLAAGYGNRVVLDPGASFTGTVSGGNTIGSTTVSTLELASGSGAGTLSNLFSQFIDFAAVQVDAGARWSLTGTNTVGTGIVLTNAGTLTGAAGSNNTVGEPGGSGAAAINALYGSLSNTGEVAGGNGGSGSGNGSGGNGGAGVTLASSGSLSNAGGIAGGAGANASASGIGNGGGGGAGVSVASGGSLSNSGRITGGTGGNGGNGASDGTSNIATGGAGGAGVYLASGGSASIGGTINGGNGGNGGGYGFGGGLVSTGGAGGAGIAVASGRLTNLTTGVIRGGSGGSGNGANGAGVSFAGGGTLANAGSIAGHGSANSVDFGTGASRLILYSTALFTGAVVAKAAQTNVLELASAASSGTLSSLTAGSVHFRTTTITNFNQITIDGGADWMLSGGNSLASGMVLTNAGTLELAGTLTDTGSFTNTGTLIGAGLVTGPVAGAGVVIARGGMLDLAATPPSAADLGIDTGATLELGGAAGAAQTVLFDTSGPATLLLDDPADFAATIGSAVAGDSIAMNPADAVLNAAMLDATGHILTLTGSLVGGAIGGIGTLDFAGALSPGGFSVANNAVTLTQDVACFLPGTLILTEGGEVPVEDLTIGELVMTRFAGLAPVRWIGYRDIDCARHPDPRHVFPVRVAADAFGPGRPHRDTWLSPDHAVAVGEALIPIRLLLNGATIRQDSSVRHVRYLHVELARHDLLVANGMQAESYLDTGNRGMFANADVPLVLHPFMDDAAAQGRRETLSCLPLRCRPAEVEPVWHALATRAEALGWALPNVATTTDPALRVALDGRRLQPVVAEIGRQVFVLPGTTGLMRLISRATVPNELRPWLDDRRSLGVMVRRLTLRHGQDVCAIPLDHPALRDGWWALEQDGPRHARWTNGDAALKLALDAPARDGPALLEVAFGTMPAYAVTQVTAAEEQALRVARRM